MPLHSDPGAHNIVINEDSGFAYATGSNGGDDTCGGGLHMIDIHDPENPQFADASPTPLRDARRPATPTMRSA